MLLCQEGGPQDPSSGSVSRHLRMDSSEQGSSWKLNVASHAFQRCQVCLDPGHPSLPRTNGHTTSDSKSREPRHIALSAIH